MIKRFVCKIAFLGALWSGIMGTNTLAAAPSLDTSTGMPNPIVVYKTYDEAANAAGFNPLYLPKLSGYTCNYISLIEKKTIDLGFQKQGDVNKNLRIRTALKDDFTDDDISGAYSVAWEPQIIDNVKVYVGKINRNTYAAHWKQGKYLFSANAKGVSQLEFKLLLSDGLVDLSNHYFD
ncbi:hypothetical protein [Pectinatus frisingensis]|uniref:hypothetical protein n=1 Tax=Pectinatus frisingensis TaxID=865 RepID=UPI0018C472C4|nr:hypothetical protein [Pectinatus frisingensis]